MAAALGRKLISRISINTRSLATKPLPSRSRDIPPPHPRPSPSSLAEEEVDEEIPTSGISRPLSEILKELSKRVPDHFVKTRNEDGFISKYVPWHIVNRILNLHVPEWSGEV